MQNIIKLYTDKIQHFNFFNKKYIINKHHILKLISFYLFFINYICNYIKIFSFILNKRKYFINSMYYYFLIFKIKYLNITQKQILIFFKTQSDFCFKKYKKFIYISNNIHNNQKIIINKSYFLKKNIYIKFISIINKYILFKYNILFIRFTNICNIQYYILQKYIKNLIKKNKTLLIKAINNIIYVNYLVLTFKEQNYIQQLYIQHDVICYFFTIKINTIIVNCIDLFSKKILFNTTSTQFGFSKFKNNIRIIFEMLFKVCYEYSYLHKYKYIYIYIRLCPFLKKRIFFFKMLNSLFKYKQKYISNYKYFKKNKYLKKKKNNIQYYLFFKYFHLINILNLNINFKERNLFILNVNFFNQIEKKKKYKILIFQIEYLRVFGGCRLKKIRRKRKHSRQFFKKNYKFNFFWKFNKI